MSGLFSDSPLLKLSPDTVELNGFLLCFTGETVAFVDLPSGLSNPEVTVLELELDFNSSSS